MIRDTMFRKPTPPLKMRRGSFCPPLRKNCKIPFTKPVCRDILTEYANGVSLSRPVEYAFFEGAPFPCAEAAENMQKEVLSL